MKKYIEAFPAYTMEADRDLLQRRAKESINRARQEFEAGLELEGASELSDEGLSTKDRTDKFFNDDSVRNAATDYVWKREMTRISTKDQQTTRITFNVAQVLTFLLFAPIWWYFFTNVPTREFTEVFAYSAKVQIRPATKCVTSVSPGMADCPYVFLLFGRTLNLSKHKLAPLFSPTLC